MKSPLEPKQVPQIAMNTPVNMNVTLPDGGSLNLHLPNVQGDTTAAVKAALQSVIENL